MTTNLLVAPEEGSRWERTLHAFLAEKHRRSGSARTVEGYGRLLIRARCSWQCRTCASPVASPVLAVMPFLPCFVRFLCRKNQIPLIRRRYGPRRSQETR